MRGLGHDVNSGESLQLNASPTLVTVLAVSDHKNTLSKLNPERVADQLPVLYQLFDGVGRTLDNFPCSDAVDNSLVEPSDDSRHVRSPVESVSGQ